MWEDELFDEIQKGDKVYYENEQGQTCKGKAMLLGPMGWVLKITNGQPKVVNDGYSLSVERFSFNFILRGHYFFNNRFHFRLVMKITVVVFYLLPLTFFDRLCSATHLFSQSVFQCS